MKSILLATIVFALALAPGLSAPPASAGLFEEPPSFQHRGGCRKSSPAGSCCHMDNKAGKAHCHKSGASTKTKAKTSTKAKTTAKGKASTKGKAKTKSKAKTKTKSKAKAKSTAKAKSKAKSKAKAKAKSKAKAKTTASTTKK